MYNACPVSTVIMFDDILANRPTLDERRVPTVGDKTALTR